MKRHGRVRITFNGIAKDSWAELELPVEEVVSGLWRMLDGSARDASSLTIEGFFNNGEGVRVSLQRVVARRCAWCGLANDDTFRICKDAPKGCCAAIVLRAEDVFVVKGRGVAVSGTLPDPLPDGFTIEAGDVLRRDDGVRFTVRGVESDLTSHPFAPGKSFGLVVGDGDPPGSIGVAVHNEFELLRRRT